MRLFNPPLSFNPKILFVTKNDHISYTISTDNGSIGWLITRNGIDIDIQPNGKQNITESDRDYIINEFLKFNRK
ncbi:hypothetical protein SAMN05421821_113133 [Mucilaginibacter lappiensis]|uniref:Uncharacterized protein n=1 Tax=Mucilaginibacter lappiensis TaxID=354630 RepID=A0ABR6PP92_9SPHI|nr:hypothetical protein [Mucilaginibacter lappiensis]SIR85021.1 hypothetical protein SAMN05421821_113133 [Mucilaginibacter lappiensis]